MANLLAVVYCNNVGKTVTQNDDPISNLVRAHIEHSLVSWVLIAEDPLSEQKKYVLAH